MNVVDKIVLAEAAIMKKWLPKGTLPKRPRLGMMFLGAPGAGKGTYASRIAPLLNIPTISAGDLVRDHIKRDTPAGLRFKSYANKGDLVPDQEIIDLVTERLGHEDCSKGYLLDGFPRTLKQAEALETYEPLKLVVNVDLKKEYLLEKLLGRRMCPKCGSNWNVAHISDATKGVEMPPLLPPTGSKTQCACGGTLEIRADDNEEVVSHRLKVYDVETKPLYDFYVKKNVLVNFEVKKGLDDLPILKKALIDFGSETTQREFSKSSLLGTTFAASDFASGTLGWSFELFFKLLSKAEWKKSFL